MRLGEVQIYCSADSVRVGSSRFRRQYVGSRRARLRRDGRPWRDRKAPRWRHGQQPQPGVFTAGAVAVTALHGGQKRVGDDVRGGLGGKAATGREADQRISGSARRRGGDRTARRSLRGNQRRPEVRRPYAASSQAECGWRVGPGPCQRKTPLLGSRGHPLVCDIDIDESGEYLSSALDLPRVRPAQPAEEPNALCPRTTTDTLAATGD